MIHNNYVSIVVIYHPFIDYGVSGSNCLHSMLYLRKDHSVLIYKQYKGNISKNHVIIFVNLQEFSCCGL